MVATAVGVGVAIWLSFLGWYLAGTAEVAAGLQTANDVVKISLKNASDQTIIINHIRIRWTFIDGNRVRRSILGPVILGPGKSTLIDDPSIPENDFRKLIALGTITIAYKSRPPFTHRKRLALRIYTLVD